MTKTGHGTVDRCGQIARRHVIFMLRARGESVGKIAAAAGVSRAHLSLVLANRPGRGAQVRRKVAKLLSPAELSVLGWAAYGRHASVPPCGTDHEVLAESK